MPGRGRAIGGGRNRQISAAGTSTASSGLVGSDLLIWYDFTADDGGTTLTDLSGNANHGTFGTLGGGTDGISPDWVSMAGGRLDFGANNEDQIVRLPNLESLDGDPNFTVLVGANQIGLGGHSGPWWSLGIQGTASKNMALFVAGADSEIWFWGDNTDNNDAIFGTATQDFMIAMRHRNSDGQTEILRIDDSYAVATQGTNQYTPDLVVSGVAAFGDGHALMKIPNYGFASLRDIFDGNMWAFALWNSYLSDAQLAANAQTIVEGYAPASVDLAEA